MSGQFHTLLIFCLKMVIETHCHCESGEKLELLLMENSMTSLKPVLMAMVMALVTAIEVENIDGVKEHPCPELAGSLSQNHPVACVA